MGLDIGRHIYAAYIGAVERYAGHGFEGGKHLGFRMAGVEIGGALLTHQSLASAANAWKLERIFSSVGSLTREIWGQALPRWMLKNRERERHKLLLLDH